MKKTRIIGTHALAAKAVKAELKKAFPSTKFSVKSDSFSMGDSVHIEWKFGPTTEQVKKYSDKYQYGHFDGMHDMYENSNRRDDIPQAKYVQERRNYDIPQNLVDAIGESRANYQKMPDGDWWENGQWNGPHHTARQQVYRVIEQAEFSSDDIELLTIYWIGYGEKYEFKEPYAITYKDNKTGQIFDTSKPIEREVPKPAETPVISKENLFICNYNERSFILYGETYPIKERIKELGGKFNKFLTHPETGEKVAGWVFQMTDKDNVLENLFK